ncbi:MAG: hypothetical protein AB2823_03860 [Candidatus Thiodiazotropha endolucinida]
MRSHASGAAGVSVNNDCPCLPHPAKPESRVFGRELLEVEILNCIRSKTLFTLYNNHLKSHFGDDESNGQGKVENDARRDSRPKLSSYWWRTA